MTTVRWPRGSVVAAAFVDAGWLISRIGQSNLAPVGYAQAGGCLWRWVLAGDDHERLVLEGARARRLPAVRARSTPVCSADLVVPIAPDQWPVCGSVRGEARMGEVPKQLTVGSDQPGVFEHQPDLFAVEVTDGDTTEAVAVVEGSNERFVVYGRQSARRSTTTSRLPVYAVDGGPLAVPTGRVLVRLEAGESAQARAELFRSVGFEIDHLLSYAPHAAWLRPTAGGVAEALAGLDTLARLPGVAHVEPQLLMERAKR